MHHKIAAVVFAAGIVIALVAGAGQLPAAAQGDPDGWTVYDLNVRAAPGNDSAVLAILPPGTGMIFEARTADIVWLLGHTLDGTQRGWVYSEYFEYRVGFAASRLPVSTETVGGAPLPPPADAPPPAEAPPAANDAAPASGPAPMAGAPGDGTLVDMQLIYKTDHSEYYTITYLSDGLRVNGFLGYPIAPGPHPAIIYNRGGTWNKSALTGLELIPYVECGYVTIATQYRGNGGSEGSETFGDGDVRDVLNLIPILHAMPAVDPARVGMMGYSRGGMVALMALKEDTLRGTASIRTAVTVGAITNLFLWRDDDPEIAYAAFLALIGWRPEEKPELFQARSAVFWPELISVPILILHGEADAEISVDHANSFSTALKDAGRPHEIVVYPGGDHSLSSYQNGLPVALDWFQAFFGYDGVDRTYVPHEAIIQTTVDGFWRR